MDIKITNRVWLPAKLANQAVVDRHFTIPQYDEAACSKCPLRPDRHTPDCDNCVSYKGDIRLWREKLVNSKRYIGLPPGDLKRLNYLLKLDKHTLVDTRPIYKFKHPIKFTGELFDGTPFKGRPTVNQKQIVADWLKVKSGMIKAPAGSGKTVMAAAITCALGVKTIFMAHEERLLDQFYNTMVGTKDKAAQSNIPKLREKTGKPIIGIIKKMSDFKGLDIAITTYQKFIRATGNKRIKQYINSHFSFVAIDEIHQGNSVAYASVISRLTCRYRLGLSATLERKDGRSVIMSAMVGRILAEATTTALTPRIELWETGVTSGTYSYRSWVGCMQYLARNEKRKKMIIREIFKDLRAGHSGIIIPVDYKSQAADLVKLINRQAEVNRIKRKEDWPDETAAVYQAGVNKTKILNRFEKGKIKVLVAIRGMIKQGVDMTAPSMLYVVVPMSANDLAGAPMFYQLSFRVARWDSNNPKKQPIVKVMVDGVGFSSGCFRSLFFKEIMPGLRTTKNAPPKYKMDDADFKRAIEVAKMHKYTPKNAAGERLTSAELLVDEKHKSNSSFGKVKFR